jgi:hypothetical protein
MRKYIDPWVILGLFLAAFVVGIVLYGAPADGATPQVSVSTKCLKENKFTKATSIGNATVVVKVTTNMPTDVTFKIGNKRREYSVDGTRTFRTRADKYAVYYFHDGQMVLTYGYNYC